MEGEMQPADEGPCAAKMCRPQRGPYSTLKPFQSRRSAGKSRFDRSAVAEVPLFGDGHPFTFHPDQLHPFQQHQQQQRLQQLHQTSVAISSSQQHHQTLQQHQHRLPCETRPSSRVPTSTSAAALGSQQRRASDGGSEPRFSPDCTYGISAAALH